MNKRAAIPPEIPGLRFLSELGQGGFADVFKFEQTGLGGRDVAVKVLTADLEGRALAAFEAEAAVMARLSNHPSIVSIFAAGTANDGRAYLVMEVCQPDSLGRRIRQAAYPVPKALEIGVQIAGAVESAHRLGILHRDIKPANILFTEYGRPALTDFGISVSTADGQQGLGMGMSPAWAPPEQMSSGTPMGPAGDVYALAATIWAMLVGRSPFEVPGGRNDNMAIAARVRNEAVPPTGREDVPEDLERVLRIAMAKQPEGRYPSALEFARALQSVQNAMHLPPTTIEVRDDDQAAPVEEVNEGGAATRISHFAIIDPDGAPAAAPSSRPATSAAAHTVVPEAHQPPAAPVVPSPRPDTTTTSTATSVSPTVGSDATTYSPISPEAHRSTEQTVVPQSFPMPPEGLDDTYVPPRSESESAAVADEPQPDDVKRRPVLTYAAIAVLVLLIGGIVAVQQLTGASHQGTTDNISRPSENAVADPVGIELPRLQDVKAKVDGKKVVVSWRNAAPETGDVVLYRVADPVKPGRWFEASEGSTEASVDKSPGQTCVEVILRRTNGQASQSRTACAP